MFWMGTFWEIGFLAYRYGRQRTENSQCGNESEKPRTLIWLKLTKAQHQMSESQNRSLGFFWRKLGRSCDTETLTDAEWVKFPNSMSDYSHLRCLKVLETSTQGWQTRHKTFWESSQDSQSISGGTKHLCLGKWTSAFSLAHVQKEHYPVTAFYFTLVLHACLVVEWRGWAAHTKAVVAKLTFIFFSDSPDSPLWTDQTSVPMMARFAS